jgi:CHC2 zinc finger/Toprim-like
MNCEEANQIDMVRYLNSIGYQPQKIRRQDHWYLSPFRKEKEPSFKVSRSKNVWYDHGLGKGGTLVDFVMQLNKFSIRDALNEISSFHPQNNFKNSVTRPPVQSHQNRLLIDGDATETAIKIIAAKQPIQDLLLCRYLRQRMIEKNIADKYCHEVLFTNSGNPKEYRAIGFKNNAGGYELRNEYFKGSSSPKDITYLDNKVDNLTVLEGFFDFISYQSINQNQEQELTNFLVLNSLSFFEKSFLLMEKHGSIHLYLDRDAAGIKCTNLALNKSPNFKDESKLYKGYKDLNDWIMNFGKLEKQINARSSVRKHF